MLIYIICYILYPPPPGLSAPTGDCSPGFYCPGGDSNPSPVATPCPIGLHCPLGSGTPVPCTAGSYANFTQADACLTCPMGYYCVPEEVIQGWGFVFIHCLKLHPVQTFRPKEKKKKLFDLFRM